MNTSFLAKIFGLSSMQPETRREFINAKNRLLSNLPQLNDVERNILEKVSTEIDPADDMYAGNADHYLCVGLSAITCIDKILAQSKDEIIIDKILDLPCGYSRVLRFLGERFPKAKITACDLDTKAVRFSAKVFNAAPVISVPNINLLELATKYDLIWCGSLVTHLNEESMLSLMRFFANHLTDNGICVVSSQGDRSVNNILDKSNTYGLTEDSLKILLDLFHKDGYGYVNYPHTPGYGISIISPDKFRALAKTAGLKEIYFEEHAWDNHHDIFGFKRDRTDQY